MPEGPEAAGSSLPESDVDSAVLGPRVPRDSESRIQSAPESTVLPESTRTLLSEFRTQLYRTVDFLTSMPLTRLERPDPSGSVADRAYGLSSSMVAANDDLVGDSERALPRLRPHGAGSQLAVVGQELAARIEAGGVDSVSTDLVLMDLVSRLLEFRRVSA